MEWFVNDLSLHGQFGEPAEFRSSIEPLVRLLAQRPDLRRRILCSRNLSTRSVTASMNLAECVRATQDRVFIAQVLRWISSAGPFWDDDRAANEDDYFHFEGEDVTDQGLGEAARRLVLEFRSGSFSFPHPTVVRFARTPLCVDHGLEEDPLGSYDIENWWDPEAIATAAIHSVESWQSLLETATSKMAALVLSDEIAAQLSPVPFHSGVAQKFLFLLGILQRLSEETSDGALTAAGLQLHNTFFNGQKALFTDESDRNKRDFKAELTFADPVDAAKKLFCSWHGKVKFGSQYRIHFEWPRPKGQTSIKIAYIGPKITKR